MMVQDVGQDVIFKILHKDCHGDRLRRSLDTIFKIVYRGYSVCKVEGQYTGSTYIIAPHAEVKVIDHQEDLP